MPAFKLTLSRYQIINTCLQSRIKKYWSIEELLAKLEEHDISISKRTLEKDFETMRFDERLGYFAPIKYCPINRGYYYEDSTYSINAINLSPEEIQTLVLTTAFIRSLLGSSVANGFHEVIEKIISKIDVNVSSGKLYDVIECQPVIDCRRAMLSIAIMRAIYEKQPLMIKLEISDLILIHPFLLHSFEQLWYVVGYIESENIYVYIQLDQVLDIVEYRELSSIL